jgi:hypothetical protein
MEDHFVQQTPSKKRSGKSSKKSTSKKMPAQDYDSKSIFVKIPMPDCQNLDKATEEDEIAQPHMMTHF